MVFAQQPTEEQMRQVEEAKNLVVQMKGKPFPEFDLITSEGNSYTSNDMEGKIILFNFWFSSCKPCIEEMPELNKMVDQFKNEDVLFLAPTFDDSATVRRFLTRFDFDYEIITDEKELCLEMNVRSFPTHFIVDRKGIVEKVTIGYSARTVGMLRKTVKKLLRSD